MSHLLLVLAVVAADVVGETPAEHPWFYPGTGPEIAMIDAEGTVRGVPVGRTGRLLARVDDPGAIAALPQVARVTALRGDGHVVSIVPAPGVDEIVLSRTLHLRDDVTWSHPDFTVRLVPMDMPDDPYVVDQWHLENDGHAGWTPGVDINAETAWTVTAGGGGIVAIIDSGVDTAHEDLDVIPGWDYIDNDDDPHPDEESDAGPHGTSSAGVASALGDNGIGVAGVAYDTSVYAIRLIGGDTDYQDIYDSFAEGVDAGAWVLSNSWGFGDDCPDIPIYSIFQEAMDYAEHNGRGGLGTAIVTSAGNGNCDNSNDGFQAIEWAISVAATDGHDHREWYSSYGDVVDVAAPSGSILTTDISGENGYGDYNGDDDYNPWFSGTSASAPVVSGTVALMFAANPRLTAAQARDILCETAVRNDVENGEYNAHGWSRYYGCGRIDAGAAVLAVANATPGAPTPVAPLDEAYMDRVILYWDTAEDPDDDWLTYEVSWWTGADDSYATTEIVDGDRLDITGEAYLDAVVNWKVTAMDLWGPGDPSETVSFTVVGNEVEEPGGDDDDSAADDDDGEEGCECSAAGGSTRSAWFLLTFGAAALLRRTLTSPARRTWKDGDRAKNQNGPSSAKSAAT